MAEISDEAETHERRRDIFGQFLQKSYSKGELALKHALGLGATENVIPIARPSTNDVPRPVEVGWHPVGGFAGKWFAEKTGLGKMITEKINSYPDPTQHWAVLVGEYAHQLWMDENFDIIYTNAKIDRKDWRTFQVGETRFNDDAVRRAGEAVIQNIRSIRPGYNLISNNCQTYVLQLLDAIQVSQDKEFGTTLAVYERLFGSGEVAELFTEHDVKMDEPGQPGFLPPPGTQGVEEPGHVPFHQPEAMLHPYQPSSGNAPQTSVSLAQQVMDANTVQLDTQEQSQRNMEEEEHESAKWSAKTSSFFRKLKK